MQQQVEEGQESSMVEYGTSYQQDYLILLMRREGIMRNLQVNSLIRNCKLFQWKEEEEDQLTKFFSLHN